MKKFLIVLFLGLGLNGFGQSPTYTLTYSVDFYGDPTCPVFQILPYNYSCTFNGYTVWNDNYDAITGYDINNLIVLTDVNANPNQTDFTLTFQCACEDEILYNNPPRQERVFPIPARDFIENAFYGDFTSMICPIKFYNADIRPNNLTIANRSLKSEVCSGEMLDLEATPAGFHPQVYHWQYSLDNQVTWLDVPQKKVNGLDITNVKVSNFTMYDILGDDHDKHFGDIYFRMGYGGGSLYPVNYSSYNNDGPSRPFSTNTIKINYAPCAPVVTDVVYEGPKCNDYGIQKLEVYFDNPLDATKGEVLYELYARETKNNIPPIKTTPMMQVSNVTYPSSTNVYAYSNFAQFSSLEKGREYEIIYQVQVNHPLDATKKILKGVLVSAKKFTYNEPAPLTFTATALNPLCSDGTAGITVTATGGTPPYYYILDGGAPVQFTTPFPLTGLSAENHTIKVIDSKNCFEK